MSDLHRREAWPQRFALLMAGVVVCFVLTAGAAKLLSLPGFASDLREWSVIPVWAKWIALYSVPPFELLVGGLWLLGIRRGLAECAMAGLLLVFSAAYGMELALGKAPSCGCLGQLAAFHQLQRSVRRAWEEWCTARVARRQRPAEAFIPSPVRENAPA